MLEELSGLLLGPERILPKKLTVHFLQILSYSLGPNADPDCIKILKKAWSTAKCLDSNPNSVNSDPEDTQSKKIGDAQIS